MGKVWWCFGLMLLVLMASSVHGFELGFGLGWHGLTFPKTIQTGMASWYGREQQGAKTANGETFDRHKFTAAHRRLPFNTIVRVTNQKNGRSVQVRINDRGPYAKGRVIDLSEAAADALDMKKTGVAPVKIEIIRAAPTHFFKPHSS